MAARTRSRAPRASWPKTSPRASSTPADIDRARFERYLDTADLPAPDLLIRTSGESRLSNFMLWQAAYAELVFLDVLWPDFDKRRAGAGDRLSYQRRERRFGGPAA